MFLVKCLHGKRFHAMAYTEGSFRKSRKYSLFSRAWNLVGFIRRKSRARRRWQRHEVLRPVLIVKKFNRDQFWAVPFTTTIRPYPHYYLMEVNGSRSSALFHQLRSLDKKRLFRRIAIISKEDFVNINEQIANFLYIERQSPSSGGALQLTSQSPEAEAKVSDEPAIPQA